MRAIGRRVLIGLALLTIAGGALRAHAAVRPSPYQSADERAYTKLARAIATRGEYETRGMDDPVHWPPGAPALFAAAYALDPPPQRDGEEYDIPSAHTVQAVVATALIPLTFALAFVLAGPGAGLAAAAGVALYPPLARTPSELLSEPLGALLACGGLLLTLLALRRPAVWRFAAAGLVLGLTVLTRADLLLVPLIAATVAGIAVAYRAGALRGLAAAGPLLIGALAAVVPWSVFASGEAGHTVPVSSGGASNLFVGTYLPGEGTMFGAKRALAREVKRRHPGARDERAANLSQELVIQTVAERRPRSDPETALRDEALQNIRRYALGDPSAFAAMAAAKVRRLWLRYTVGTHRRPLDELTALHVGLVLAAAAGLAAGLWRRRSAGLVLLALVLAYVTALNAIMVSEPRHHLPVLPVLLAAGAAGTALAISALRAADRPALSAARRAACAARGRGDHPRWSRARPRWPRSPSA